MGPASTGGLSQAENAKGATRFLCGKNDFALSINLSRRHLVILAVSLNNLGEKRIDPDRTPVTGSSEICMSATRSPISNRTIGTSRTVNKRTTRNRDNYHRGICSILSFTLALRRRSLFANRYKSLCNCIFPRFLTANLDLSYQDGRANVLCPSTYVCKVP